MPIKAFFILVLSLLVMPMTAHAYIGPGTGAGTIAAVVGVIGSIIVGLFAIIYYPIKRAIKRKKAAQEEQKEDS